MFAHSRKYFSFSDLQWIHEKNCFGTKTLNVGLVMMLPPDLPALFFVLYFGVSLRKGMNGLLVIWHSILWVIWESHNWVIFSNKIFFTFLRPYFWQKCTRGSGIWLTLSRVIACSTSGVLTL